jgi:hypothetical protein
MKHVRAISRKVPAHAQFGPAEDLIRNMFMLLREVIMAIKGLRGIGT